jgi:hypothetical protein
MSYEYQGVYQALLGSSLFARAKASSPDILSTIWSLMRRLNNGVQS